MANGKKQTIIISIITGIIGSIIFSYLLSPLLNFIGNKILLIIKLLSTSMLNTIYRDVSSGNIDYSFYSYQLILLIFIGCSFLFCTHLKYKYYDIFKETKPKNNNNQFLKKILPHSDVILRFALNFLWIIIIFLITLFVCITSIATVELGKRKDFNQELIFVKPYINSEKYDQINSLFNSMDSYYDYKNIYYMISNELDQNKKTPHNYIYTRIKKHCLEK